MGRTKTDVTARHVTSVGHGYGAIAIRSTIDKGPASVIGRDVSLFLSEGDIASVFASLATMPAFRNVFHAVADEIERRDNIYRNHDNSPVERLSNRLDSIGTANAIHQIALSTIEATERQNYQTETGNLR